MHCVALLTLLRLHMAADNETGLSSRVSYHLPMLLCLCAALGNIVSVLGLFFFIYAVIGMNLWGAIKEGMYINRQVNFHHVGMALLTLFRMVTGVYLTAGVTSVQG